MDGWGLGYDELSARNPRLVYAAGSAFGALGPDASRTGADLSAQASGGLISGTGADGGDPTPVAVTIADHIASQNLVAGILAALVARGRTGRGQRVDVSLLGSQIWAQASEYTYYLLTGSVPGRSNKGHPMIPAHLRDLPDLRRMDRDRRRRRSAAPRLLRAARPARAREQTHASHRRLLDEAAEGRALPDPVRRVPGSHHVRRGARLLAAADIRYAPVRDYAAVAADPQVWENGYLRAIEDDDGAEVRIVGSPIALSEQPATGRWRRCPSWVEHTEEVLLELGYSVGRDRRAQGRGSVLTELLADFDVVLPRVDVERACSSRRGCGPPARSAHDRRSSTQPCRRAGCAAWGTRRGRTRTDARSRRRTR